MASLTTCLRLTAVAAVVAAVVDPGCAGPVRPRLALTVAGQSPDDGREATLRRVQALAPWADVVVPTAETRVDAHLVAGEAAPVLAHLREHPAALAIRREDTSLEVTAVSVPARVTAGSRVAIAVQLDGTQRQRTPLRITIADAERGVTEAAVETREAAGPVEVPWLAVREGPRRLRVRAEPLDASGGRPSAWVDVGLEVTSPRFTTHLLEARPTWVGRFTRLALAAGGDSALSLDVRAAPGVTVQRRDASDAQVAEATADVVIVSGLEALTPADVSRLDRLVRDGGRVLVLLADQPPDDGPWRRLWPADLGRMAGASTPRAVDIAGARWRTREWLAGAASTRAVPLAYVDKGPPAVLARSVGDGRVVLVTALDAWRWRAEPDVAWAAGWQALLRRLAAEVPPPVAVTAWVSGSGIDRVVQVDARVRGDVVLGESPAVETRVEAPLGTQSLTMVPVQARRWRGGARMPGDATARVIVAVPTASGVGARGTAVVHVGRVTPPASWGAVRRHQEERGVLAADNSGLASSLAVLQSRLVSDDGPRWFVTRTWWYAALVLAALGSEWVIRRARRLA